MGFDPQLADVLDELEAYNAVAIRDLAINPDHWTKPVGFSNRQTHQMLCCFQVAKKMEANQWDYDK